MKKTVTTSIVYTVLALIGGVFYREFTKFRGFTGETALSVVHTHYLALGMGVFLLLFLLERSVPFLTAQNRWLLPVYHVGLNLTALMLVVRGVAQVTGAALSAGQSAAISGVAGIGHLLLGVSLVLLLVQLRKAA